MNIYHKSWKPLFDKYIFDDIKQFYSGNDYIYPKKEDIFRIFEMDVRDIKVLLLGQDSYHVFFGSNIFKQVEEKLNEKIDWSI